MSKSEEVRKLLQKSRNGTLTISESISSFPELTKCETIGDVQKQYDIYWENNKDRINKTHTGQLYDKFKRDNGLK